MKELNDKLNEIHKKHEATLSKVENKIVKRLKKTVKISKKINPFRVPTHIAFIMDGNGRWAKKRGMPRKFGHKIGSQKMMMVLKRCIELGIKYVSFYAFSTENWSRPKDELDEMFRLARLAIERDAPEFMNLGVRLRTMGDTTKFPQDLQDALAKVTKETEANTKCTIVLCVNYGGRAEIVNAAKQIKAPITEEALTKHLYCSDIPHPDLIVRTSGERRLSNFMLWQAAYAELLFIQPHWPAMTPKIVDQCIIDFQNRKRRFGKVD